MTEIEFLRQFVAGRLSRIASLLPAEYKLTLVARHTTRPDADIIVTDDRLDAVVGAVRRLAAREGGASG